MRKLIDKFSDFQEKQNINENFTKNEKIVELDIVDLDKEDILLSIKVLESTAKDICNALYKDRKNGGKYSGMFDDKDYRYWK